MHPLKPWTLFVLSPLALGVNLLSGTCNVNRALGSLAGTFQYPLAEAYIPEIDEQATSFCNGFLGVERDTSCPTVVSTIAVTQTTVESSAATITATESTMTTTRATGIFEADSTLILTWDLVDGHELFQ